MAAAARYAALAASRSSVLDRARDAARLTIPGIVPEAGQNEHTVYVQPYQSVGARGVASLAARSLVALFPPNVPFFRLSIDASIATQLGADLGEANMKLAALGTTAYAAMEQANLRPHIFEVIRHLIVAGNVLLWLPEKAPPRVFRIDQYVVKRDHTGRFQTIIVCEKIAPSALPEETRTFLGLKDEPGAEKTVDVYTVVERDGDVCHHWQEVKDKEIPGSRGKAPADSCGWLPLRWLAVPGSCYGRSHVTEYIGDLLSLEDLSKAIVEFAAVASRIITVVDPNSGMDIEELAEAETGDYIHGNADHVRTLQLEKGQDWAVMKAAADDITRRVYDAFMVRASAIRNAERVTAEEVRMVAEELETTLGGTYTLLSSELQLPIVRRFLYLGVKAGTLPALPDSVRPNIVTGFDALGRAAEVNRMRTFIGDITALLGPQAVMGALNSDEVIRRLGVGYGIEGLESLLKSPEQQQAEAQQSAMQQAAMAGAPAFAKAAMEAAAKPKDHQ